MRYVGLDVHKQVIEAAILDGGGTITGRLRFAASSRSILAFIKGQLQSDDRVALEATTNTWAITNLLRPHVGEVVVSNPMRTRAIAEAKVKTDKVDAEVLAQLLRCDYLPRVWQPDPATLSLRKLCSRCAWLGRDRTRHKNRIRAILQERLVETPANLFDKRGLLWLRRLELNDEWDRYQVDSELRLIEAINAELATLDQELDKRAYKDPRVKLLMTIPGVDVAVAAAIVAAIGDITRFANPKKLASYFGLSPSTRQSANRCYNGKITKQGNAHARWMLVEAAQHLATNAGPLGVFFRRLKGRKNHNVAVVATARKLATIAWHMLTQGEPYRYAKPQSTKAKLARLRVSATGERRTGGARKGQPRTANYGSGDSTRFVPSLGEVYDSEGIPPLQPIPPGERRNVARTRTHDFVEEISSSRRVPRKAKIGNQAGATTAG